MALNDMNFKNGMIFVCDASTQEDMIRYQVFGLPSTYKREMKSLIPGESALFLLEKHTNLIKGIFVPTCTSQRLIVSDIWKRGEMCAFPSQIKFGLFCRMPPFRKHSYIAPEFLKTMKCKGKYLDQKRTQMMIQSFRENAYRLALEKHVFSAQTLQREQAAEQYKRMVLANTQKQNSYHKMKDQITNLQDEIELLRDERFRYEVARDNLNEERFRLHDFSLSSGQTSHSIPVTIRPSTTSHDHSAATIESAAGRTVSRSPVHQTKAVDDGINVMADSIDRLTTSLKKQSFLKATAPSYVVEHPYPPPQVEYNPYLEPNPSINLSYPYANEFDIHNIPHARAIPLPPPMHYGPEYGAPEVHYLPPTPGLPTAYVPEYHYPPLRVESPFYPYPAPPRSQFVGYPTHI